MNVSRPYLIKMLETGVVPYHKVGSHRRVRFLDLKDFKDQAVNTQTQALDALAAQAQGLGMGY